MCSFVDKILPFDFESVRNISKEFECVEPVIISPSSNDKSRRTPRGPWLLSKGRGLKYFSRTFVFSRISTLFVVFNRESFVVLESCSNFVILCKLFSSVHVFSFSFKISLFIFIVLVSKDDIIGWYVLSNNLGIFSLFIYKSRILDGNTSKISTRFIVSSNFTSVFL